MAIQESLKRVVERRETLSTEQAADLMRQILAGEAAEVEVAALLGAMGSRGETGAEIAGFVLAMREAATLLPITPAEQEVLVDTCGTGADGSGTFNISTAAALVAAAAGAKVAKHGNRAVTSSSGSADVLEALGVPVTLSPEQSVIALRKSGFAFLLAPAHHPAMKAVSPLRRALGVRTILHVLGPLLNPAGARRQVMGVYSSHLVPLVAEAMVELGVKHAMVVHGAGGMDEISISGPSDVAEVRDGVVRLSRVSPEEFGLPSAAIEELLIADADESAATLRAIFTGETGARCNVVVLNAAAVLVTAGLAETMHEGVQLAQATLRAGKVEELIRQLQQ